MKASCDRRIGIQKKSKKTLDDGEKGCIVLSVMRNAAAKFLFCLSLGLVGPTAWCKTKNQIVNNANLSVSITDLEDNYFVTGTGVNLIGGVSAMIEQNNPDTTWNRIERHPSPNP